MRYEIIRKRIMSIELMVFLLTAALMVSMAATINAQTKQQVTTHAHSPVQQPLYREYRGIRLGMTATEVRARLGDPVLKSDEQDYFQISANELAQIAYNAEKRVVTISTDYNLGIGAPDCKSVVGGELRKRPNGSEFAMVMYESEHVWVSYNRGPNSASAVTITIGVLK